MKELHKDLTSMLEGINQSSDAVASTLGPHGRNIYISDVFSPKITNDGARTANSISFKDPLKNAGAFLVNNTSAKTNDDVGDGTTTTVVLLKSIIEEARKRNENPNTVRLSLKEAKDKAVELLKKKSVKANVKDVKQIALVSGEYPDLADLISEIVDKIGKDAMITVEDSKTYDTYYDLVEGYEAKVGYLSPWFITDPNTQKAVFEDIPVFVSARKVATVQNINEVVKAITEKGGNQCAFFVSDMDERVLGVLVGLKLKGQFNAIVVRMLADELEDIAGASGAMIVGEQSGLEFAQVKLEHLGKANKLVVDAHSTLCISDPKLSSKRAMELELKAADEPNEFLKKRLQARAARLRGKIAVLHIGANNDLAREHKKDKAEDAVKAVPAALAEGLVPGAGQAWYQISDELEGKTIGEQVLKKALKAPYEKILENSGTETVNLDIQDPAKVERVALENAVEAAGIFITTSHAIVDDGKEVN